MRNLLIAVTALSALAAPAYAGDAYAEVTVTKILSAVVPEYRPWVSGATTARQTLMAPRVVLRGGGEAFVDAGEFDRGRRSWASAVVRVKVPAPGKVTGLLLMPDAEFRGMTIHPFSTVAAVPGEGVAERFGAARARHYRRMLRSGVTGAAWFRHRLGVDAESDRRRPARNAQGEFEETFGMLTGGRALSENLSLDRVMAVAPTDETATVPLDSIQGITVPDFDWTARLGEMKPALDALAAVIPADQHALFFPSFTAMTDLLDEADAHGTPILRWFETEAVDAGTRRKYERQLLLSVSELARLMGPHVVKSAAMTGSDLYLRTGTDIAIVFEAKNVDVLDGMLKAQRRASAGPVAESASTIRSGTVQVDAIFDRSGLIRSFQARIGQNAIAVSNSISQLQRLAAAAAGEEPSLATLDEYRYFRARYPMDEPETAFLMITDRTLRRWCGPRWRIATSRRTRAAALLAEYQARLADGNREPMDRPLDLGTVVFLPDRVESSTYGRFEFLTPIVETSFDRVTPAEKEGYERWRRGYESNWKQFYDPIAGRILLTGDEVKVDLSVLPLKLESDYQQMMEISGASKIVGSSGDPHPESLMHYILAIDRKSRPMREIGGFSTGMTGNKGLSLLDWIGETVSVCFDDGPFVDELLAAEDPEQFLEDNWSRLPVGIHVEIANGFKFIGFIAAARAFVAVSAPNMVTFEPMRHRERQYMKVSAKEEDIHVYYTSYPGGFFITLSELMVKQQIDRFIASEAAKKKDTEGETKDLPPPLPWAGESVAFRGRGRMLEVIKKLGGPYFLRRMQDRSWSNLPILAEWRRLYPDEDPVAVHERFFGVRPVCPGGKGYRWNTALSTFESVVYGHPASPRGEAVMPAPLRRILKADLGLTFEEGGVRAKAAIVREKK